MRGFRKLMFVLISALLLPGLSGCWNYAEVDDMSIVAGVAIDKDGDEGKIQLTTEMVDNKGGLDQNQAGFKMLSLSGDTMFEIVRDMISLTGKKLFWSHAKAIIFSEEIARDGLTKVIDWYSRDTETRSDVFIFVSDEKTAREVLNLNSTTEAIMSFELAQMMRDEQFTNKAPVVEIWDFIDKLETSGNNAIAPLISLHEKNGQKNERVDGTAVFVKDKMVGKLDGEETQSMLFAKDKIRGGVLEVNNAHEVPSYSLEILESRTKVKPKLVDGRIRLQLNIVTHTGLDEVMTSNGFSEEESIKAIEQRAGEALEQKVLSVIHKVQEKYQADIFGFGEAVHRSLPKTWSGIKKKWPEEFTRLEVDVHTKVIIQSTAKTSRAIKLGD
ncbi:Ger(x)C family spore germination protein [Paenibacillus sp. S150]|uniref:Ger(x)C family spore germination protein n=1 Tax=Paenibacillus sp. S150 TaxID=2749826 RepID=UPI001C5916DE|nr:Ger(x)C family spore germination protein [Paenibacillus sp. S150]MBW4085146.1 Ger(x)C family spore germination protein [Paenibacillus sp. S150]